MARTMTCPRWVSPAVNNRARSVIHRASRPGVAAIGHRHARDRPAARPSRRRSEPRTHADSVLLHARCLSNAQCRHQRGLAEVDGRRGRSARAPTRARPTPRRGGTSQKARRYSSDRSEGRSVVLAGGRVLGARSSGSGGPYGRSKTVGSVLAQRVGRRRMLRYADQAGFAERHTVPRCLHARGLGQSNVRCRNQRARRQKAIVVRGPEGPPLRCRTCSAGISARRPKPMVDRGPEGPPLRWRTSYAGITRAAADGDGRRGPEGPSLRLDRGLKARRYASGAGLKARRYASGAATFRRGRYGRGNNRATRIGTAR